MATLTFAKIRVAGFRFHREVTSIEPKLEWFHRNDAETVERAACAPLSHNSGLFERIGFRLVSPHTLYAH
jgi:hypothetical protein